MAPRPYAAPEILNSQQRYVEGNTSTYFDDGREYAVHEFVLSQPPGIVNANSKDPASVVAAIDSYAERNLFLMTLGQHKLKAIRGILEKMEPKPKVIVELGTYIGYSAVAFGGMIKDLHHEARDLEGVKVFSMELDQRWATIAQDFVNLAGVNDVVEIVIGSAAESIRQLHAEGRLPQIDVLLLDHWEKLYIDDLQVCEELGLLKKGAVVLADNVVVPGAPEYLKYVRSGGNGSVRYKSEGIESMIPSGFRDVLEVSKVIESSVG